MDISLNSFLHFVSASGRSKVARVDEAKDGWDAAKDFYKKLREHSVYAFRHNDYGERLHNLPHAVKDGPNNKRANYSECIEALDEFRIKHQVSWISAPPSIPWTFGELQVRVNPEMLLDVDGEKLLIKLYWSKELLRRHALDAFGYLVQATHGQKVYAKAAILDVRRSRLRIPPAPTKQIEKMVRGEAAHFVALWKMPPVT